MRSIVPSLSPWVQRSLGPDGMAQVRDLRAQGIHVAGHAASSRGPFTVQLSDADWVPVVGVGSTALEALDRAMAKLPGEAA